MPTTSKALSIGSLFHECIEAHYSGRDPFEPLGTAQNVGDLDPEYLDIVEWMLTGYIEHYKDDPNWEVIEVEKKFEFSLGPGIRIKGKVDLLVKDNSAGGGIWCVDHKTHSKPIKGKALEFDDQFGLYAWLLKKNGIDVRGVIHNAVRTERLKRAMTMEERFKRTYTTRADKELKRLAEEAYAIFNRGLQPWSGQPPRGTDTDRCTWKCDFTEVCLMARKGPDIEQLLTDVGATIDTTRH